MDFRIIFFVLMMILMNWGIWAGPLQPQGAPLTSTAMLTVCGPNDMVEIQSQNDQIKRMARPIGLLRGPGFLCTGTLVGKDLFLTAHHCEADCASLSVRFNYLHDRNEIFTCKEIIDKGNDDFNQDYLLLRLEGMPGVEWGWYDLSDRPLTAGQQLMIIHHPEGSPQKLSLKNCSFKSETDGLLNHNCDTNPGTSGSAIIVPDFAKPENSRIVGIHTLGGCNEKETSFNAGPAIHYISGVSPTIRSLVK
ncbi:MAG: trypsin-like peptidase domain-containing protein [Deltaproteobacteria bacterium]|nr:trypsin-like peptidase domain-containing protein [Deltaproteobacteria bacterium]MBI3294723.1 trypsin-like peptidase domain-containing protein [Deltaproteobacteria bacterium]